MPCFLTPQALSEKLDVYSLAMVFYSMLAHKPPFVGEPESRKKILNGIPPVIDPSWDAGFMEVREMGFCFLRFVALEQACPDLAGGYHNNYIRSAQQSVCFVCMTLLLLYSRRIWTIDYIDHGVLYLFAKDITVIMQKGADAALTE